MKTHHGFIIGLMLVCTMQPSLHGGEAETYSMDEVTKRGTPPIQTKRVEPVTPIFYDGLSTGMTFYKYTQMSGKVTVDFIIDEQGRVRNARAVRFSNPMLVEPTIEAIRTWKYAPAIMDGQPVRVAVTEELGSGLTIDERGPGFIGRTVATSKEVGFGRSNNPVSREPHAKGDATVDRQKLPPDLQWDNAPVLVGAEYSVYPRVALQARQEGSATIKYVIDRGGRVAAAQVLESTTPEMGQAALAAIETWVFTPATKKDGTPCAALQTYTFRFSYHGRAGMMVGPDTRKILRLLDKNPAKVVPPDKLDRPLKPVLTRAPVFPVSMRTIKNSGQAEVDMIIDTNGEVQLPTVASSTTPEFGYAAVQAVSTWRFDVPRSGGKPVVTRTRLPVVFKQAAPAQP